MDNKSFLIALLLAVCSLKANAQTSKYDVNSDGAVNAADVVALVNYIMNSASGQETKAPEGAEAVDLGLPNGTKWANMNVGAERPEDYGLYFAWGETEGYGSDTGDGRSFDWASYKWMNEGQSAGMQVNKYQVIDGKIYGCWYDSVGKFIGDGKTTLELADDAAYANWGDKWRMPTIAEIEELVDNTTFEWTTVNGVAGQKFTSKTNGNSIFLPASGGRDASGPDDQGRYGYYWLSSLNEYYSGGAHVLVFASGFVNGMDYLRDRYYGFTVRPVLRN